MNRLVSAASLACATFAFAGSAFAHNDFELDAAVGYRFPFGGETIHQDPGGGELGDGKLEFEGAMVFSGMAGYRVRPDAFVYLSYTRGVHDVSFQRDDPTSAGFDFTGSRVVEYFQFGGKVEATRGRLVPYLGFTIGLGRIASVGGGDDRYFFTPVLEPGAKIDLHEHVHLRLMGRTPLVFAQKDIACVAAGCAHAEELKPLPQLELLGGLGVSF